jgi:Putative Ig domain
MGRGRHARRPRGLRALRRPLVLFACAFALASGTAAFAYTTVSGSGTGLAQAVALEAPGVGTVSAPTATTLSLSWTPSPGLPAHGGYLVLRSTAAGGPYAKSSSGTCQQDTTIVSAATSCTDTGLTAGTTYYYEIESTYYDVSTLWVSATDASFSGTTGPAPSSPTSPAPAPAPAPGPSGGTPPSAPAVTSAGASTFLVGTPGAFQVSAKGNPAPAFSNTAFTGCTPSTLPPDLTFSSKGLLAGSPVAGDVGSYTVCVNAANGVAPVGTQKLTLTVVDQTLVFSSPAASGAASGSPNLGPVTVRRQTAAGAAITAGAALTVSLSSNPPAGATFGLVQFASAHVTSVTIPAGQSSATFWYGAATPGSPAITASATGAVSGTQVETVTTAPAGLGVTLGTGSTGSPVLSCGPTGASDMCNISGVGPAGKVVVSVGFRNADGSADVYSGTQASTVLASGPGGGSATIGAGAAGSGPLTLPVGTSSLSFGPYTVTVNVAA